MKLKEKLAEACWLKYPGLDCRDEIEETYIAGFEKAREMAARFTEDFNVRASLLIRHIGEGEEESK